MSQAGVYMSDPSQVANARRLATGIGKSVGLPEADAARLALVVTELGTNLIKHARQGELWLRANGATHPFVQVISVDRGPGMTNPSQALLDGFSTAGSPGTGLGAIQRQACSFEMLSSSDRGTVIFAEVRAGREGPGETRIGGLSVPHRGEQLCGDGWKAWRDDGFIRFVVADGLGHGLGAFEASEVALKVFEACAASSPKELVRRVDQASRHTRGIALAIGEIDLSANVLRFSGVGNISAGIVSGHRIKHLVSQNGTVGHTMPGRVDEIAYEWTPHSILVVHSDGVSQKWKLDDYPGLTVRHSTLISSILYRDYSRGRDDSTVVVVKGEEL